MACQPHHYIIYIFIQTEADELNPFKGIQGKIFPPETYSDLYLGKVQCYPTQTFHRLVVLLWCSSQILVLKETGRPFPSIQR